jgi:hypothetical protein
VVECPDQALRAGGLQPVIDIGRQQRGGLLVQAVIVRLRKAEMLVVLSSLCFRLSRPGIAALDLGLPFDQLQIEHEDGI